MAPVVVDLLIYQENSGGYHVPKIEIHKTNANARDFEYEIDKNGCWICTSHANENGYPWARMHVKDLIHRHVYRLKTGNWDIDGIVIRHTCDNPRCINPDHLIAGTHADNVRDRVERNRSAVGERHGRSKLTEAQVMEIINDDHTPKTTLARKHKVDAKVIRDIKNKKTWRCVHKKLENELGSGLFRIAV